MCLSCVCYCVCVSLLASVFVYQRVRARAFERALALSSLFPAQAAPRVQVCLPSRFALLLDGPAELALALMLPLPLLLSLRLILLLKLLPLEHAPLGAPAGGSGGVGSQQIGD